MLLAAKGFRVLGGCREFEGTGGYGAGCEIEEWDKGNIFWPAFSISPAESMTAALPSTECSSAIEMAKVEV